MTELTVMVVPSIEPETFALLHGGLNDKATRDATILETNHKGLGLCYVLDKGTSVIGLRQFRAAFRNERERLIVGVRLRIEGLNR